MQKQKPPEEVPVAFDDVQIYQAIQAEIDTPVTLSVLLDRSNRFQVHHVFCVCLETGFRTPADSRVEKVVFSPCMLKGF